MVLPATIYVYGCSGFSEDEHAFIRAYLQELCPWAKIKKRPDFFSFHFAQDSSLSVSAIARQVAATRVYRVNEEVCNPNPFPVEIDYEQKRLTGQKRLYGVIYDGMRLLPVYGELIHKDERTLLSCHIIFTDQLLASFESCDKRYHLRVGMYGLPPLISLPGITEALAKPREYYLQKQVGVNQYALDEEFKEKLIACDDSRRARILQRYVAQALFYHVTAEAFCEKEECLLYNAHWQHEVLATLEERSNQLCSTHQEVLTRWRQHNAGVHKGQF